MKKNLSLAGYSLVAMGLLMGSCVSKKKYMDTQASAAQRYTTDSTAWASRSNTMQQNISSLEEKNTTYQKQVDSFRTASENYQKRWDNLQSTYTKQNSGTEQLHQQIHTAIDQYVEASNVESRNGKIYINLPEKLLFASANSTTLSSKGKQALDKLAEVLASNQDVEVDVVASAAYYNGGMANMANNTATSRANANQASTDKEVKSENVGTVKDNNAARESDDNVATKDKKDNASDNPTAQKANIGDSSYPSSGSVTARNKTDQDGANKTKATAKTSTKKTSAAKQGDRSVSFRSTPKSKTKASAAPSWNVNVARSTAIVRELTQSGLPQARIILSGQGSTGVTTNEWAAGNKGYQIILSPKMDSYYQMMQQGAQGQGSTSMK